MSFSFVTVYIAVRCCRQILPYTIENISVIAFRLRIIGGSHSTTCQKSKLLFRSSCRSSRIPGGNRGSFPSAMYPRRCKIMAPVTVGKRTERHLHALFGVKDDCWVILGTVTSGHGVDKVTHTLYGILGNGTEGGE